jgi:C4-type Zn-finger protein
MSEELKPCPKCKSTDVFMSQYTNHDGSMFEKQLIVCDKCYYKSRILLVEDAIKEWNTRDES